MRISVSTDSHELEEDGSCFLSSTLLSGVRKGLFFAEHYSAALFVQLALDMATFDQQPQHTLELARIHIPAPCLHHVQDVSDLQPP